MSKDTPKEPDPLQVQVARALERIPTMSDAKALERLHTNIISHQKLDDGQREELNEAVILQLRHVSPALASRLGGAKDAVGRVFLEEVFEKVSTLYDLSGNQLKQGVKTGGYMINGTRHVDVYLSYKTTDRKNLSFAWIQENVESEPFLELLLRDLGKGEDRVVLREVFQDRGEALARYEHELKGLLDPS